MSFDIAGHESLLTHDDRNTGTQCFQGCQSEGFPLSRRHNEQAGSRRRDCDPLLGLKAVPKQMRGRRKTDLAFTEDIHCPRALTQSFGKDIEAFLRRQGSHVENFAIGFQP